MGNVLSEEELQELKSHIVGITPDSLAKVIRHTIDGEGKFVPGEFGIHFAPDLEGVALPLVYFWQDNCPTQRMTKKNFLCVLEFVGEETLANCTNRAANTPVDDDVMRLILAMESLRKELNATGYRTQLGLEMSSSHGDRNDSGFTESTTTSPPPDAETVPETDSLLQHQQAAAHANESESDDVFDDAPQHVPVTGAVTSLRQLYAQQKGIAGVLNRLPELRIRLQEERNQSTAVQRVRTRLQSFSSSSRSGSRDRLSPIIDIEEGEHISIPEIQRRASTST